MDELTLSNACISDEINNQSLRGINFYRLLKSHYWYKGLYTGIKLHTSQDNNSVKSCQDPVCWCLTCRIPGSRSAKCFSRAVLLSLAKTKDAAARADRVRIWRIIIVNNGTKKQAEKC